MYINKMCKSTNAYSMFKHSQNAPQMFLQVMQRNPLLSKDPRMIKQDNASFRENIPSTRSNCVEKKTLCRKAWRRSHHTEGM